MIVHETQGVLPLTKWLFAIINVVALAGCATKPLPYPPRADVVALTEAKPKPGADVLTDPAANDRYNAALEARGDRLYSAGVRLCRFFRETGMDVDCPG